jgi:GTPase SAR1 family protein
LKKFYFLGFRDQWPKYTANSDVILYVVDSHDVDKLPEAKKELHALLEDSNLKSIPVLIVLNKIDLDQKYTKTEISKHLNLDYLQDNPWAVVPISALRGTNIVEVVDWLVIQTP